MTAIELKHQAHLQQWSEEIRNCRSSGLPVKQWCNQRGITATTYYRWERQVLAAASATMELSSSVSFAELPVPKKMGQLCRNVAECSATLRIGSGCIEFHQELSPELLKILVETLLKC